MAWVLIGNRDLNNPLFDGSKNGSTMAGHLWPPPLHTFLQDIPFIISIQLGLAGLLYLA